MRTTRGYRKREPTIDEWWEKFDFAHRSSVLARPGSRELRAVKIPASYDAWRPPKRRKNDSGKNRFFWVSEISFSSFFLDFRGNRQC